MGTFTYNDTLGIAEAELTMFRFADTNRVNFQCEVQICKSEFGYSLIRVKNPKT